MKNEKEILKLLSHKNRKKFDTLEEDSKKRIAESLCYAYQSITFVDKKDYYEALKKDYLDYLYFHEHRWEQYSEYRENGDIDAIHNLNDLFASDYYNKHFKFEDYPVLEKDFPDEWKMFVYPGDTHVIGKLPILKTKEKEIMNIIFEHMLRYKSTMGKCIYITRFVSPFSSLSHEEIVAGYEELWEKYKPK
jgi:hypothetical protein